jgi:hypothetical protein
MNVTQKIVAPSYAAGRVIRFLELAIQPCGLQPKPLPGFVTFYDPGWSIVRLRSVDTKKGTIFYPQTWYDNEPFATFEEPARYRQLRMAAVPDSFDKNFKEQQALLPADEEVPSARVVVMGMVIHFLATDERLFPNVWVRCIDNDSDGLRIYVDPFRPDGLRIYGGWHVSRGGDLGLASSRKF